MYPSCQPDTWIGSPSNVLILSYFKTAIITPVHFLCAYCIIKKTPTSMKSVKWTLLNFHFWNVFVDFMLNLFSVPIPLFPTPSGVLIGVLSKVGVKPTVQLWIMFMAISMVCISTTMIFENRFHLLNAKNIRWKKFRPLWMVGNILFCSVYAVPTMLQVPDQESSKHWVLKALPCVPDYLPPLDIVVPSIDQTIIIISSTTFVIVVFGQLLTFAIIIMVQLSTDFGANMLSDNTRKLQRNLMKALIWQTGIPVVYLVLPVFYATFSFAEGYFSMAWNNTVANVASLHGLVSTLSIILIHKPYRSTVVFWVTKKKTTVADVRLFSTNTNGEFSRIQV